MSLKKEIKIISESQGKLAYSSVCCCSSTGCFGIFILTFGSWFYNFSYIITVSDDLCQTSSDWKSQKNLVMS